jgi:hypothetical protein
VVEKVVIYKEEQPETKEAIVKIYVLFQNAAGWYLFSGFASSQKINDSLTCCCSPDTHKAILALNNRWFAGRLVKAEPATVLPFS